jgi:hypothetical protein
MAASAGGNGARRYEILIRGELSDRFQSAFDDVQLRRVGGNTALVSVVDQAHLRGLLERIQELGLDLLSVKPFDRDA